MRIIRAIIDGVSLSVSSTAKDKKGVTALEYGVIAAAIVIMLTVAVPPAAAALQGTWAAITAALG